ncbi:MAG TPA: NAD-dependent epimerase/dehydratase family protein [Thermomicrobiales bacterium]|nr:NAD-dependent epimerase/dehydratase family protein [Thermomicrobiales bacterium]
MTGTAMTGTEGFLGWHTRCALREQGVDTTRVAVGDGFALDQARTSIDGADRLIHIAGVNRGTDDETREGNVLFATQVADAVRSAERPPRNIVYANSTQARNGTPYGEGKARAAGILADAASAVGAKFIDIPLPNLYGEHGRPFYNAVTATFCHLLANGGDPKVEVDRELTLLHAQDAADLLTGARDESSLDDLVAHETVTGLLARLERISATYSTGDIPDIASDFDRNLFNTYRSYTFDTQTPIRLTRHADARGSFFEVVRSHGGTGQSSFSTTGPGVTRGDHFHRRKVERFTVLAGKGTISLRRLFTDQVHAFDVSGDEPVAIDMPTMWAHNIVNTGEDSLYTSFWANDIFNPEAPDTIPEVV